MHHGYHWHFGSPADRLLGLVRNTGRSHVWLRIFSPIDAALVTGPGFCRSRCHRNLAQAWRTWWHARAIHIAKLGDPGFSVDLA